MKQLPLAPIVWGIFVVLFVFTTVSSFVRKSPTADEPVYLFAGYSYLKWKDFRANPEHPPLVKILAALPLLALDIKEPQLFGTDWDRIPQYGPGGIYTANMAAQMIFLDNDADTLFFYARLPMIAIGIFLGMFVYLWARELFGAAAAIVSLFVYSFDPNILAHSQLVHTDLPFTAFFFIGTYFFWHALGRLTWPNLLLACVFFGLAAITHYAYVAVLVIWGVLGLVKIISSEPLRPNIGMSRVVSTRRGKTGILLIVLLCALTTAYFSIWAAYGFRFHAIPNGQRHLPIAQQMPETPLFQSAASFLIQERIFPEAWIYGQLRVLKHLSRKTYLLGHKSDDGFWLYFPVAFAAKTPLPTLLVLFGLVGVWFFKRGDRQTGLFLLVPVAIYFSLAVWSRLNIGLGHILPLYPFLFVLMGGTVVELWKGRWIRKAALTMLAVWYVWSSVKIYPHYLAFFNELVGGPKNGHRVLLDSNLDWGQELKELKLWMDANHVGKIQFLYFGFLHIAAPQYYKIDAIYLPGSWVGYYPSVSKDSEVPNYLAISANHLQGLFLSGSEEELVKAFRSIEPVAIIGYSIFIYEVHRAIERYERVVEANPASVEPRYTLANLLYNQRMIDDAIGHYRRVLALQPEYAEAHEKLGRALLGLGRKDEAIKHIEEALRLFKARAGTLSSMG